MARFSLLSAASAALAISLVVSLLPSCANSSRPTNRPSHPDNVTPRPRYNWPVRAIGKPGVPNLTTVQIAEVRRIEKAVTPAAARRLHFALPGPNAGTPFIVYVDPYTPGTSGDPYAINLVDCAYLYYPADNQTGVVKPPEPTTARTPPPPRCPGQ